MGGSAYWAKEIRKANSRSPKEGAIKRMDRLRSQLADLDPVVANRAWREVGDGLQKALDRYTK